MSVVYVPTWTSANDFIKQFNKLDVNILTHYCLFLLNFANENITYKACPCPQINRGNQRSMANS